MTSPQIEDAFTIRPMRPDDVAAVLVLYEACMETEPGIVPFTAEGYAAWLGMARSGYGRDFLVMTRGTEVVSLAESSLRDGGPGLCRLVKLVVHPDHRRRGLGTRLLRAVLDQGPADAPVLIESLLRPRWQAGLGFASRFGFAVTETELIMRCEALRPFEGVPAGLAVARGEGAFDAPRIAALHNTAFRDEAGFVPMTGCETPEFLRGVQLWTARIEETIVAYALVAQFDTSLWLDSLAVDPAYRRCGVGGALATRALVEGRVGAGRPAGLNVSASNAAARALYARLGFTPQAERPRYGATRAALLASLDRR